ncbi:hypothetical protein ACCO45_003188 [Purpureocillium lilacinum]|uniref:Uncharacterized protein n=1 Tax=Purpureocillium lilacinum TaxID=33203 RepID=A0ACC4DZ56_PURLI
MPASPPPPPLASSELLPQALPVPARGACALQCRLHLTFVLRNTISVLHAWLERPPLPSSGSSLKIGPSYRTPCRTGATGSPIGNQISPASEMEAGCSVTCRFVLLNQTSVAQVVPTPQREAALVVSIAAPKRQSAKIWSREFEPQV